MNILVADSFAESNAARRSPAMKQIIAGDHAVFFSDLPPIELEKHLSAHAGGPFPSSRQFTVPSNEQLLLVVQKGRLFQRQYPDVPVVLDRGRYLVIRMDAAKAAMLRSYPPCYSFLPVADSLVAYENRHRFSSASAEPLSDAVSNRVDALQMDKYKEEMIFLTNLPTRHSLSPHFKTAADWSESILKGFGFNVEQREFSIPGGVCRNVIARKSGQGPDGRPIILIGAHLDSINIAGGPSSTAPGADDNASGSAGVLAIGRAFSNYAGKTDLWLTLFGGEEQGLFGSQALVASLPMDERSRLASVINMDMIGNLNTSTASVLLEGANISQGIIDNLAGAAEQYTSLSVQTSLNPFNSDHVSFIDAGVPAVLTIEGTDSANSFVHTEGDTVDEIDFALSEQILRMLIAYVSKESGSDGG